ncbi:MAG: hypothetical protein WAO55_12285, partial [Candidatus Manganitrophaceae bacterium]
MLIPVNEINVHWSKIFSPIPGFKTDHQNNLFIEREMIPVIFVPGTMGSRLRNRATQEKVWDPDYNKFMFSSYGAFNVTPAMRKALLVGSEFSTERLEVIEDDERHHAASLPQHGMGDCAGRGWGGIFWGAYGGFLKELQRHEWTEPICHCFEFPVHAFGYNWTASNDDSGKKLAAYINDVIAIYKNAGRLCEKVILITHS